tara:strand:+ start:1922 stop:2584 length:663 start_codon:yes stop_codon:yes gene_type:complete
MINFKLFVETTQGSIDSIKSMISNPDPERVKMYGGTRYVDMLKTKLDRMLKVQAIKSHLKKSPLAGIEDGETENLENRILDLINQNKKEEAKELNFKMYDNSPEKYKELYYKITGKEGDIPEEDWEKGTSKAPKGKSFDMSRGGKPSNVDAARDGSGGRYRKTRPPSAPSNKTHSEMEEHQEDAEDRCKRKADQVYGKKTSAYKSGAIVRCRKGKIWKKK